MTADLLQSLLAHVNDVQVLALDRQRNQEQRAVLVIYRAEMLLAELRQLRTHATKN